MKYIFFLIVIFSIITSCSNPHEKEIKTIDSLLVSLDSAKIKLYRLDTGKVYRHIRQVESDIKFFIEHSDAAGKEDALYLDKYNNARKGYASFVSRFPFLYEEIETIPVQLKNLRKDLVKNLLTREEAVKYVDQEMLACEGLITTVEKIEAGIVRMDALYDESREKVLHLIQAVDTLSDNSSGPLN